MKQMQNEEQCQKEMNERTLEELKEELRKLKKKQAFLVYNKNHYEKLKDYEKVNELRKELKEIKEIKNRIGQKISTSTTNRDQKQRKEATSIFLRMEASLLRELKNVSSLTGDSITIQVKRLENGLDSSEKWQILNEVIPFFEEMYANLKEQKEQLYQELANVLGIEKNKNLKKEVNQRIKTLNEVYLERVEYYQETSLQVRRLLERFYTLRGLYHAAILKKEKEENRRKNDIFLEDGEEIILNHVPSICANDISFQENVKNFLEKDILEEFDCVYINLKEMTDKILDSISTLEKGNIICLCNIMKNRILSRINELKSFLPKEEVRIYILELKRIEKRYRKTKKDFFERNEKENKKDAYYDLFETFFFNPKNYYYVERVLDTVEDKLSASTIEKLIEEVLDLFVKNHKLKMENEKLCEVEPSYYFRILTLFQKKQFISESSYETFTARLEELTKYACEKRASLNRDRALSQVESLMQGARLSTKVEELDSSAISKAVQERMQYINIHTKVKKDELYPTKTFTLENFAYSIQYNEEGNVYFKVHVLDTSRLIFEDTTADEVLKKHMLLNQKVSFDLPYEKGMVYPVITFQYRIYNNNSSRLKIFEENIRIDEVYNYPDLKNYRDIPDLKALVSSYKKIWEIEKNDWIHEQIEKRICEEILSLLKNCVKEVPCMYKQSFENTMEDLKVENACALGHILYRIDKKMAHKICSILKEDIPPIYTTSITDETYLELHSFSYDSIHLYRSIKKILNETYDFHNDYLNHKNEIASYCQAYNEKYSYLDTTLLEEKKKKIKRH